MRQDTVVYGGSFVATTIAPRTLLLLATLATLVTSTRGTAWGQAGGEDPVAAKAHFAAGLRHFNLTEYEQALGEFKEGYRSKPDPVFLYNIGQCHRKLGHIEEAITFYRSYLREAPDAKNRDEVERRIGELESLRDAQNASSTSSEMAKPRPSPTSQAAQERAAAEASVPGPGAGIGLDSRAEAPARSARPTYKRWWFWAATGAVVVGAATVGIVMARRDPTSLPESTLGAQRAMP
jgi:tetratricopeptide (TPR) repeat protein